MSSSRSSLSTPSSAGLVTPISLCSDITADTATNDIVAIEVDDDDEEEVGTKRKKSNLSGPLEKKRNAKAVIWNEFEVYVNHPTYVRCVHCKVDLALGNSRSTTNMFNHFKHQHSKMYRIGLENDAEGKLDTSSTTSLSSRTSTMLDFVSCSNKYDMLAMKWIVMKYLPFSTVEDDHFREMQHSLNPKATNMSAIRIVNLVNERKAKVKVVMDQMLKDQQIAITTDGWTSKSKHSYYAFTAHWIDDNFVLRSCPLGIKQHVGKSEAADHLQELRNLLERHGFTWNHVVGITTDTEPTMNATGRMISETASHESGEFIEHIGCVDHILNCTTKLAGLDPDMNGPMLAEANALKQARSLVGKVNKSTQLKDRLLSIQDQLQQLPLRSVTVIQDIVTRWWSTYSMCERLLRLKTYIAVMANEELITNLSDAQWALINDITSILRPFMTAQKVLEGEKYITISLVPSIISNIRKGLKKEMDKVDNSEYVSRMLRTLFDSFQTEWGCGDIDTMYDEHRALGPRNRHKGFRQAHMLAAALDPRSKGLQLFGHNDKRKIWELLTAKAESLAKTHFPTIYDGAPPCHHGDDDIDDLLFDLVDVPVVQLDMQQKDAALMESVAAEISSYKSFATLPRTLASGEHPDPLVWWRNHKAMFPILSKLARRILCIPATSASSERLFSTAGLTIANDRASLLPDNAVDLIFLHDTWRVVEEWVKRTQLPQLV